MNDYNYNGQNFTSNENIGQPNGMPVYPYIPSIDPEKERKKQDKKILTVMGACFGLSIILYEVVSTIIVLFIRAISSFYPRILLLIDDSTALYAFEGILSILGLGIPFLIAYLILRSKKYVGILPYGTTYNKEASQSLVLMMAPIVLVTTIIINLISYEIQKALDLTFTSGLEDLTVDGTLGSFVLIVSVAFIPALIEEFCIRGVVLQSLRRYGDWFAIITSAIIFSILHGNMVQIPYAIVAGIYFGYVCVATGSIWPSVVLHFINNLFSAMITIISSKFGDTVSGGATLVMFAFLVVVGIIAGSKYKNLNYKADFKKGSQTLTLGQKFLYVFRSPVMVVALVIMIIIASTSVSKSIG